LYTINLGDSRAILSRDGTVVSLSTDIKPTNPQEMERIESRGGKVSPSGRVLGLIGVSRSIGDIFFKNKAINGISDNLIISDPMIQKRTLSIADEFIVLGCDGLWDVMTSNEVRNFVAKELQRLKRNPELVANALAKHAIKIGSSDNVSVIVALIKKTRFPEEVKDLVEEVDFAPSNAQSITLEDSESEDSKKKKHIRKESSPLDVANTSANEHKEIGSPLPKRASSWRVSQVSKWVKRLGDGIEVYATRFEQKGIDGKTLLKMNITKLQELGIEKVGHRIRIQKEISMLLGRSGNRAALQQNNLVGLYMKHVSTWDVYDVGSWLENIGLGEYKDQFAKSDVNGRKLVQFTKNELQAVGVPKLGHRIRILKAIHLLHRIEDSCSDDVS